jgi:uncharacterized membrane protein YhaH (DUF805 family)
MDFFEAISSGFNNYANFRTRAIRSEYWFWTLFVVLLSIVAKVIDLVVFSSGMGGVDMGPASAILFLAFLVPGIAIVVRRLHDGDRSGWWMLLVFIPLIGAIVLLVWFCTRGTVGPNRFGPDPLEGRY